MIINGGLECTTTYKTENSSALKREGYYSKFLEYFGLPAESGLTCATMQPFDAESASNVGQSLDKNWNLRNSCQIVAWFTNYSVWRPNDYKRCVCNDWAPTNQSCLAGALNLQEDQIEID